MSMDDFTTCLEGEYNQDAEAVRFIVQMIEIGGADLVKWIKDNWAVIAGSSAVIAALAKYGGESIVAKFLARLLPGAAAAALDALAAVILGLGLAAVLLAITAGVECSGRI
jgi:hypothetical protein